MTASGDTIVLGIETSCDETAAAVVTADRRILSDVVLSQIGEHAPYGGVVPEIAARAHVEQLDAIIARAIEDAGVRFDDLAGVAATAGPGLIGGVIVGLVTGKAIAMARKLPLIAVNHLEGHALSARLIAPLDFPYLLLLISGGHCQLLAVEGVGRYRRLGTTVDDAVGEAFDKTAKVLDLGYPGGPKLEAAAGGGNGADFDLPRPMLGRAGCDFSFSGLKTAVRRLADTHAPLDEATRSDLADAFQRAVGDVLCDRTAHAIDAFLAGLDPETRPHRPTLVVAGGVAANSYLRARLDELARSKGVSLMVPPARLCTDNGAMIAWAGIERLALGLTDDLDAPARARWPLDAAAAPVRRG